MTSTSMQVSVVDSGSDWFETACTVLRSFELSEAHSARVPNNSFYMTCVGMSSVLRLASHHDFCLEGPAVAGFLLITASGYNVLCHEPALGLVQEYTCNKKLDWRRNFLIINSDVQKDESVRILESC